MIFVDCVAVLPEQNMTFEGFGSSFINNDGTIQVDQKGIQKM
jgi:hypothetical protein